MPFDSISALKSSESYRHSETLQKMPSFRLRRFIEVFNRVFATARARGASDDEAESNAFPLAFAAARRFHPPPSGEAAEAEVHYFATMMPEQFSMGGKVEVMDFGAVHDNLDILNAAVAGNTFRLGPHASSEPVGVIRALIRVEDAPPDVQARAAEGTPFITVASYFEDTPDAIRDIETVSAEWLQTPDDTGATRVILPDAFVITEDPAADTILGVGRIAEPIAVEGAPEDDDNEAASERKRHHLKRKRQRQPPTPAAASADNPYEGAVGLAPQGQPMPDKPTQVAAEAELSAKVAAAEKAQAEAVARAEAAEKKHDALVAGLASLSGKDEDPETFDAEAAIATLRDEVKGSNSRAEKAEKIAAELKAAAVQAEAENAASALVDEGRIATDAIDVWAALYVKDGKESFDSLVKTLPRAHPGVKAAKATANLDIVTDKDALARLREEMAEAGF